MPITPDQRVVGRDGDVKKKNKKKRMTDKGLRKGPPGQEDIIKYFLICQLLMYFSLRFVCI